MHAVNSTDKLTVLAAVLGQTNVSALIVARQGSGGSMLDTDAD